MTDRHSLSNGQGQGMNWISPKKRLAIYLRDGLACVYCGSTVEDGVRLTLDHLRAHKHGGSNKETNLVTCCLTCNSARGKRSWKKFAEKVAGYLDHDITADMIVNYVMLTRKRVLDVPAAKALIDARGGFSKALYGGRDDN
jgi:hypothetical protein